MGKAQSGKLVGGERRVEQPPAPTQQGWQTDKIDGADEEKFAYQFMLPREVPGRQHARSVFDRNKGENVRISGWEVSTSENDPEVTLLGDRPDLGVKTGTVNTMGEHVLMRIPRDAYDLLQHEKNAVADGHRDRLLQGGDAREDFGGPGIKRRQDPYAAHQSLISQVPQAGGA